MWQLYQQLVALQRETYLTFADLIGSSSRPATGRN